MIADEPAFWSSIPEYQRDRVKLAAKAICKSMAEEDEEPCNCTKPSNCVAVGLFGQYALAAVQALDDEMFRKLGIMLNQPAGEPDDQHDWFVPDFLNYECCRNCGIVRREDGKNKPCKGRVTVELRSPVETGWLIELGTSVSATPSWYCGDFDDCWTTDSLKAIRYARKEDAQRVIDSIGWTEAFPTEHQWLGYKRTGEPDGGADGEKR